MKDIREKLTKFVFIPLVLGYFSIQTNGTHHKLLPLRALDIFCEWPLNIVIPEDLMKFLLEKIKYIKKLFSKTNFMR